MMRPPRPRFRMRRLIGAMSTAAFSPISYSDVRRVALRILTSARLPRPPRPRFTLRRLMAVVAIVAVLLRGGLAGAKMIRLSREYRARAAGFAVATPPSCVRWGSAYGSPRWARWMRLQQRRREYREQIIAKYERAARYPWLPVEPDPPEPE